MIKLSKLDARPRSLKNSPITGDNIALYFFPDDKRAKSMLDHLIWDVIGKKPGLKVVLDEAEKLVFPSKFTIDSKDVTAHGGHLREGKFKKSPVHRQVVAPQLMKSQQGKRFRTWNMQKNILILIIRNLTLLELQKRSKEWMTLNLQEKRFQGRYCSWGAFKGRQVQKISSAPASCCSTANEIPTREKIQDLEHAEEHIDSHHQKSIIVGAAKEEQRVDDSKPSGSMIFRT
ncbi:hypothetical protein COCNU_scaffold016295G000030 [Cocos nucifera]|nr:hypothetical protein [Cocos nucifera]